MKKILFLSAAASVALLSCSRTEVPQSREDFREIRIAVEAVTDAASEPGQPDLKSVWKDGVGLQWSADDATRLGLAASGVNLCSKALDIASSGTAEFTVNVPSGASEGLAYYPYSSSAVTFGANQSAFSFTIASSQSQDAAGEAEYSDGKAAMTGAASLDISGGSALSAKMDIHNAFVRFLPYSADGKTEKITEVSIEAANPLAGVISVTVSGDGTKTFAYSETSDNVSVSLTEAFDLSGITSAESSKGIYCGVLPCTSNGVTYKVVTEKGSYSFVSTAEKSFAASEIVNVYLNLDKATFIPKQRSATFSNVIAAVWGASWGNSDPTEAKFNGPIGACATSDGKILLAEQWTHCIRKIDPSSSTISLYAGVYNSAGEQSGALETAKFDSPKGIIAAGEGKYVVFSDKQVQLINGTTVSLLGKTRDADGETLYEGKISQVRFCNTAGAAYDAASKAVYFACTDTDEGRGTNRHYILKWDMETDAVSVAAGNAKSDTDSQATVDGAALTVARLDQPSRMCVASDGTLYFLQSAGNGGSCVRSLKDGVVKTVAGCPGTPAYADGKGGEARFSFVAEGGEPGGGIVEDEDGNLLIADPGNHAIRKMTPEGQVTTISAILMGENGPSKWAYKNDYDPALGNKLGASQYVAHPMSIFRLEPYTYCFTQYTGDAPGVRKIVFE